ncbi:MAG: hypothetical protein JSW73_04860 [Candidatus Woesearchaeota archaeon]|nr:MAG: hypothetical protein JSW73_04860 [Candidatus Woesearchaeota archaeon]
MRKASIIITAIIILAIIVGTLLILSIVSSEIFGGISLLWLSQKPCASLDSLTEKMDIACKYGYDMKAEISIPEEIDNYKILRLPRDEDEIRNDLIDEHGEGIENDKEARTIGKYIYGLDIGSGGFEKLTQELADLELTGYNPDMNSDYEECRAGLCICMVKVGTRKAPRTQNCDFCYPVARQSETPAFCCDYGVCRFDNIGNIPNVNSKFVGTYTGEEERETRIFQGLTFLLENKTDNLTWIQYYCNETIYNIDNRDGVFIIDFYGHSGEEDLPWTLCGNGVVNNEQGEECEEDLECSIGPPLEVCNDCKCTTCGNGMLDDPPEECDYDAGVGDYVGCVGTEVCNDCKCTTCGDGIFDPAVEDCERTSDCTADTAETVCNNCECVESIFSGCCFREDRLIGPCVREQFSATNNKDALVDFVSFSEGSWPLKGRIAVEIHPNLLGGLTLKIGEYKIWWKYV